MLFKIRRASKWNASPMIGCTEKEDIYGNKIWVKEVNSLEELAEIVKSEGKIVIYGDNGIDKVLPSILIYDDWIE